MGLVQKIFGTYSERELKLIQPTVDKIISLRPQMMELSDEALKGKTKEFKERLAGGAALDDILPEAFAVVREAGRRVLGMEHYPVQLIGGIILLVAAVIVIVSAMLQEGKQGALHALAGSNESSYLGKNKNRSFQATLVRVTKYFGIVFMVVTLAVYFISAALK